jgi:amidase
MVRGDGFGTNHKGHYTTDLVDFYGRARRARAMDYSVTVKLTMLLRAYLSEDYNHHYYAKAQNVGRRLKATRPCCARATLSSRQQPKES